MAYRTRLVVMLASVAGVVVLTVPCIALAQLVTGGVGGLILAVLLFGWGAVAAVTSSAFADNHGALVYFAAIVLYALAYAVFAVPAHVALRRHGRVHDAALAALAIGFAAFSSFALPVRGLPV